MPIEAAYIYDAVKLYAQAADEVIKNGDDIRDGKKIIDTIIQRETYYSDIQGKVVSKAYEILVGILVHFCTSLHSKFQSRDWLKLSILTNRC